MNQAIQVRNLIKIFNKNIRAVDGISFDVYENEIFGLLGSNGSGKSTTLRMLSTVLEPTSGKITFKGTDHNRNKIRNTIGYIPQQDLLYEDLSVTDNLRLFSRSYNLSDEQRIQRIEYLLKKLELTKYRGYFAGDLSGGYKKRLSIAIALLHNPKIIIADEITIGLDLDLRHKIWSLLLELKKEASIIFTTHYLEEAEKLCDRIALMNLGKILVCGKPQEIIKKNECNTLEDVFHKLVTNKRKK